VLHKKHTWKSFPWLRVWSYWCEEIFFANDPAFASCYWGLLTSNLTVLMGIPVSWESDKVWGLIKQPCKQIPYRNSVREGDSFLAALFVYQCFGSFWLMEKFLALRIFQPFIGFWYEMGSPDAHWQVYPYHKKPSWSTEYLNTLGTAVGLSHLQYMESKRP